MNEKTRPRGRGCLITLLIIILLLALLCAAPFLMNKLTDFEYDDYAALAAANTERIALSADVDGEHLVFRADKADVYSYLLDEDLPGSLQEKSDGRAQIEKLGYSLTDEQASVRLAAKLFGFLPVQLKAEADVAVNETELSLTPTAAQIGPWIRVSAEKLARLLRMPELGEALTISLEDYTEPLRVDRVRIEDDGIVFSSRLLAEVIDEVSAQEETIPRLLRLYYGNDSDAARALYGDGRADYIRAAGTSLDALRGALRDVCAFGSDEYRCALMTDLSALSFDPGSGLADYPKLRQKQSERVAEAQALYSAAQTGLRNDYWHKNVILSKSGLLDPDGAPLEDRLAAEWEARIVLQYNDNYNAIVKTNEGNPRLQVPIPGLPMMSELPRDSRDALPQEGNGPFDLTVALRLPSGIPAVVFLTAEDEYGLAVISEEQFAELRESERLPIRSSGDLENAPLDTWLRLIPSSEDQPIGNYINVP